MQVHVAFLAALCILSLCFSPLRPMKFYLYRKQTFAPQSQFVKPQNGSVRLVGSETNFMGRVELYHNGEWGTVCDDDWDIRDAEVVCRQLHFRGAVNATNGGSFGTGTGKIWIDNARCVGTEDSLSSCEFNGWGISDCSHREDAGVMCVTGTGVTSLDHRLELSQGLGQLFDSQQGCDFLIHGHTHAGDRPQNTPLETVNTTVCAHSVILSRFPAFNASAGGEVSVNLNGTCQPHLPMFIRYAYTGTLDVTTATVECFHGLASHFGMRRLMEDAGRLFSELFPEDATFATQVYLYEYSLAMDDRVLQENCLRYLAWNYQSLTVSVAWSSVSRRLLEALLSRSDLVAPGEAFVLRSLENWASLSLGSDRSPDGGQQAALLGWVRFPMVPAAELLELPFTSVLCPVLRTLCQEVMLKGFQAHALPSGVLKNSSAFQEDDPDYQPRIYTGPPWSTTLRAREVYGQGGPYGRYQYRQSPSKSFSTPVHGSAIFADKRVEWEVDIFNNQQECSNRGLRCDSLPAIRMRRSSGRNQYQGSIGYSNRLLLSCQGRFICHIMDIKENFIYGPFGANLTYPCPNDDYIYHFVVRPEYV